MTEVFELLPDTMERQNLGLVYLVNEKPDEAIEVLSEDIEAPIVTPTVSLTLWLNMAVVVALTSFEVLLI